MYMFIRTVNHALCNKWSNRVVVRASALQACGQGFESSQGHVKKKSIVTRSVDQVQNPDRGIFYTSKEDFPIIIETAVRLMAE